MTTPGTGTAERRRRGAGSAIWHIRGGSLDLGHPRVMGVLNVTPDSFSDGGRYSDPSRAAERAREMAAAGADLIDIGGESTRPGAAGVSAEEEWSRVGPVFRALADPPVPLSIDTTKSEVAARALDAGASVLNDVSGLRFDPALGDLAAETGAGLILMHMRGEPRTMQEDVSYGDLIGEIGDHLTRAADRARERGCRREQIVVDPGIGFGKSAHGNLELLGRLAAFADLGLPVLVGPSRKSFIGQILDVPVDERVEGTLAACLLAFERGASIFRVHDVLAARRALDLAAAIRRAGAEATG